MNDRGKYAIVPERVRGDDTEVARGQIVKLAKNDAFMQKVRILKREETLHPNRVLLLRGLCSFDIGTLDKCEMIVDIVFGINDGTALPKQAANCPKLFAAVKDDLASCARAVDEIDKALINYRHYRRDKDGDYWRGENCLIHLGLALLWAFGFMDRSSKLQLQRV